MSTPPLRERFASLFSLALLPLLLVAVLLPFGRSAELGVVAALIGCAVLLWREPSCWRANRRWPLFLLLWACYTGAAALSALDAVNPGKSWGTVLAALRLLPLGLYAALVLPKVRPQTLHWGVAVVLAVWLADAWVQALTGHSLGGAPEAERLSGLFGSENLKLGPVLATLSPFLLHAARQQWGRRGLLLAFLAVLGPVLLAGSRASWFALALVAVVFLWRETRRPLAFLAGTVALGLAATLAVALAWRHSEAFDARMDRTLLALQGSSGQIDFALAGRAQIWHTAVHMIQAHPFNGVGVRGFRYAYAEYAAPGDSFVQPDGSGAAHAHQLVLEVLSETGFIGLALWLAGLVAALRAWRRATPAAREAAFAPGLALVAMAFPLNTHLAFYSAWWGLLFWWLLAQFCAALPARRVAGAAATADEAGDAVAEDDGFPSDSSTADRTTIEGPASANFASHHSGPENTWPTAPAVPPHSSAVDSSAVECAVSGDRSAEQRTTHCYVADSASGDSSSSGSSSSSDSSSSSSDSGSSYSGGSDA